MSQLPLDPEQASALRRRAVSQLRGGTDAVDAHQSAASALEVLHTLASAPETATDALALLHELQVHQVELDLQAEELRSARTELEITLFRQTQLYEAAPVALCTLDEHGALCELNLAAEVLLGAGRELLRGRTLALLLEPSSAVLLDGLLGRLHAGLKAAPCRLQLIARGGPRHAVLAHAGHDPNGSGFLLALMDLGADDAFSR